MRAAPNTPTPTPPTTRDDRDPPLGDELEFLEKLWRLDHALARMSRRMDRVLGVTAQQRLVVRCIGKFPDVAPGKLAAILHLDPGTISATVRALETKGVVTRARDEADQRRFALRLTARGRALARPSKNTVEAVVHRLLAGQSASAVRSTKAVLDELTDLLEADLERAPARAARAKT